jgi:hypothetical protein
MGFCHYFVIGALFFFDGGARCRKNLPIARSSMPGRGCRQVHAAAHFPIA